MTIAKSGAAIIAGLMIPAAEVRVLIALIALGQPATVPQIAAAMNDAMSDASLYSLLGRLNDQRGLVSRQVVFVDVHGTKLRRVMWIPSQVAIDYFKSGGSAGTGIEKLKEAKVPALAA